LLANVASRLTSSEELMLGAFSIEILYKPSIPDNITSWRVFDDDHHINIFLHFKDTFKDSVIDEGQHDQMSNSDAADHAQQRNQSSSANNIPKNVVRLEKLNDLQDKFKKEIDCKTNISSMQFEVVNLGTSTTPQNINLGKNCSPEEKQSYIKLFKEYKGIFTWTYEYLKTYDTKIIQHVIPMNPQTKPFQQNLRKMHPNLEPQVKEELNKFLASKIIFPVRHTQWIYYLVPVRKNNGDIGLCIYFKNLNRASEKHNYPVPPMEQILKCVSDSEMLSLLDGFYGYNQVSVSHDDQFKTSFRTKWGTYAYRKMLFCLINVGETFQRAMGITFRGLIQDCVVVYLDEVTIFSMNKKYHISHLRRVFNSYRRYGISLNPQKIVFVVDEGRILGFKVSKHGMKIVPERTKTISKILPPHNKNAMQSFLGRINFVRIFFPRFFETTKPLKDMIKKNVELKWGPMENESFDKIKSEIAQDPALLSPYFSRAFILYTYSSNISFVVVLTQRNQGGDDFPVAFTSLGLQGS
jgi:hypothetical protein